MNKIPESYSFAVTVAAQKRLAEAMADVEANKMWSELDSRGSIDMFADIEQRISNMWRMSMMEKL